MTEPTADELIEQYGTMLKMSSEVFVVTPTWELVCEFCGHEYKAGQKMRMVKAYLKGMVSRPERGDVRLLVCEDYAACKQRREERDRAEKA